MTCQPDGRDFNGKLQGYAKGFWHLPRVMAESGSREFNESVAAGRAGWVVRNVSEVPHDTHLRQAIKKMGATQCAADGTAPKNGRRP